MVSTIMTQTAWQLQLTHCMWLHLLVRCSVPVSTVVDAQHLCGVWGKPEGDMLPVPIMSPHLTDVYPVKQLHASRMSKVVQQS